MPAPEVDPPPPPFLVGDDWFLSDEEIHQWDDIPLTCGIENPEICDSCQ